tara:strand:- start:177 stop:971 length:795 start_codon:yes stop_codon:yes gene_type:complete
MNRGFSLVELSIVLVILGLLTGGILTGQSLIRAAELRSLTAHISTLQTSMHSFRDKYFALPGDMRNATDFWGAANSSGAGGNCADPLDNTGTSTQTCNGDGNGQIRTPGSGGTYYEQHRAWQHLANAGLIEGSYTGAAAVANNSNSFARGVNAPQLKLGNVTGVLHYGQAISGSTNEFDRSAAHYIGYGTTSGGWPNGPFLTPEEAWNLDTKVDDGRPAYGVIRGHKKDSPTNPNCSTTNSSTDAEYNLSNTNTLCSLNVEVWK